MSTVSTWELSTHLMEKQNMLSHPSYGILLSHIWETKILPSLMLYRNIPRRSSDEWKILCLIIELSFLRGKKKRTVEQMYISLSHIHPPMPSLVFINGIFINNCDIGEVLGEDMRRKAFYSGIKARILLTQGFWLSESWEVFHQSSRMAMAVYCEPGD